MAKKKRSGTKSGPEGGEDWRSDPRFGHVTTDPRYRSASARKATRIEIDNRFGAMFTDPDFATSVRSDKRGRPVAMSSREDLKRFYGLKGDKSGHHETKDESDEDEDYEKEEEDEEKDKDAQEEAETDDEAEESEQDDAESSESEANSDVEISSDEEFHALERSSGAAADVNDDPADEDAIAPTNRLAVTQQDWEQLKATDLYMLLASHCPASVGRLLSVTIYPSRFGQRRMAEEAAAGPIELRRIAAKKSSSSTDNSESSSSAAYKRCLRRHQLKRLWYFYAVAEFDCTAAAAAVFDQCTDLEIESTGGCLKLSYVPDGMQFGGPDDVPDKWRHLVTRCTGLDPATYKPRKLTTGSLNRTRIGLTWDETPADRTRYFQGLFDKPEFDEDDPDLKRLSEFLALSSDDEEAGRDEEPDAGLGGNKADGDADDEDAKDAPFSDDEMPEDIDFASANVGEKATSQAGEQPESRKRSRRRRLKEQAKRAKLAKAGLLPSKIDNANESDKDKESEDESAMPASEQELALLVADRTKGAHQAAVTADDVAADARFGALFTDPNYHVDPTHSEASKAVELQKLIFKRRRAAINDG